MREATTVPQKGRRWKWTGAEQPVAAVRRVQDGGLPQLLPLIGRNQWRGGRRFYNRAGGALGEVGGAMVLGRGFLDSELSVRINIAFI